MNLSIILGRLNNLNYNIVKEYNVEKIFANSKKNLLDFSERNFEENNPIRVLRGT